MKKRKQRGCVWWQQTPVNLQCAALGARWRFCPHCGKRIVVRRVSK